mgnify:FL=1
MNVTATPGYYEVAVDDQSLAWAVYIPNRRAWRGYTRTRWTEPGEGVHLATYQDARRWVDRMAEHIRTINHAAGRLVGRD